MAGLNKHQRRVGESSGAQIRDLTSPLLELFGWDESGPQVAVSHAFGLPPRGVVLGHDLKDVSPFEGKSRFLAGRGLVLQRDVVKQGSHIHLETNA